MTKAEKEHYDKLNSIGCIVCRVLYSVFTPCEIHHIRHDAGTGRKTHFSQAIPLCPVHHRLGGHGVSYHSGRKAFERNVGYTEVELLDLVTNILKGN